MVHAFPFSWYPKLKAKQRFSIPTNIIFSCMQYAYKSITFCYFEKPTLLPCLVNGGQSTHWGYHWTLTSFSALFFCSAVSCPNWNCSPAFSFESVAAFTPKSSDPKNWACVRNVLTPRITTLNAINLLMFSAVTFLSTMHDNAITNQIKLKQRGFFRRSATVIWKNYAKQRLLSLFLLEKATIIGAYRMK